MVSFFSDKAADRSGDAKSIQKTHCHKTEKWVIHGVVFIIFYCYSCKKKTKQSSQAEKRTVTLSKTCCIRKTCQYVYELWIHLKCYKHAPLIISETLFLHLLIKRPASFLPSPTSFSLVLFAAASVFIFGYAHIYTDTHTQTRAFSLPCCFSSHSSFWMECITPFWLVMLSLECALRSPETVEPGQRCLVLLSVLEKIHCRI